MKKFLTIISALLLAVIPAAAKEDAAEILDRVASKIAGAEVVKSSFNVDGPSGKANGTLEASGNKFKLTTPAGTTWCDGTNMWTSNPSTKEITLVNPSQGEINESNPFSYLRNYKADYNVYFSKRRYDGHYLILLNPKTKNSEIKAIEIAVNKKSMLPVRFIVRDRKNKLTTVNVTSMSLSKSPAGGDFVCPVESMTDYQVVDLR